LTADAAGARIYLRLPDTSEPWEQQWPPPGSDARINVRLPSELKQTIEEAAAALGQTVSQFTVSTVVREARHVLQQAQTTRLSNRDRFLAALNAVDSKPNTALNVAARRYRARRA
jgi:uncharacterized protein (DUF1778 family)